MPNAFQYFESPDKPKGIKVSYVSGYFTIGGVKEAYITASVFVNPYRITNKFTGPLEIRDEQKGGILLKNYSTTMD